jgi:hypothetical protein
MDDEPEQEPQQLQKISNEINKNVVETPLKFKDDIINEKSLIKPVEKTKNKKLSDDI